MFSVDTPFPPLPVSVKTFVLVSISLHPVLVLRPDSQFSAQLRTSLPPTIPMFFS